MSDLDILSFGETMAMLVAEQTGDLAAVEHFHKRIAGADSNVAIGLSRLGSNPLQALKDNVPGYRLLREPRGTPFSPSEP